MKCEQCSTEVNGNYDHPYLKLNREEQDFILEFYQQWQHKGNG
jgi:hypothetical protein